MNVLFDEACLLIRLESLIDSQRHVLRLYAQIGSRLRSSAVTCLVDGFCGRSLSDVRSKLLRWKTARAPSSVVEHTLSRSCPVYLSDYSHKPMSFSKAFSEELAHYQHSQHSSEVSQLEGTLELQAMATCSSCLY